MLYYSIAGELEKSIAECIVDNELETETEVVRRLKQILDNEIQEISSLKRNVSRTVQEYQSLKRSYEVFTHNNTYTHISTYITYSYICIYVCTYICLLIINVQQCACKCAPGKST